MSLAKQISHYKDRWGLVHPTHAKNSQNGLLYTAYYIGHLKRRGELTYERMHEFYGTLINCQVYLGMPQRSPECVLQESIDDYWGVACATFMCGHYVSAFYILRYGWMSRLILGPIKLPYFYNTERPGTQLNAKGKKNWDAWLGRFPTVVIMLKWATSMPRNPFQRLIFALDCLKTACFTSSKHQDPWMMLDLALTAFGSPRLVSWVHKVMSYRKLTFKQFYHAYFGPTHPLTTYR